MSRDDYLTHNLPLNYPAMQQLDTLPEGSTVRFMWEPRYHHCPDDIICLGDLIFDNWAYPIASGTDPDDLMQQWRDGDTDYILFANLEEGAQGFGYTFWLEQHENLYDINVLFPAYLEAYMQPVWTDGLGFTLYEWKENPSAPLNLPDTASPDNVDTEESN
jgi:hypothetical protein